MLLACGGLGDNPVAGNANGVTGAIPTPVNTAGQAPAPVTVQQPAPAVVSAPSPISAPAPVLGPAPAPLVTPAAGNYSFKNWGPAFAGSFSVPSDSAYQCKAVATVEIVGAFKLYGNDCVISYQVSASMLQDYIAGTLDVASILQLFSTRFKDEVDVVVLLADSGIDNPGAAPFYGRYSSVDTRTTGRARRLIGYIEFPYALGAVTEGPFLHELMHEWANRGTLPNPLDSGHWGFASVGGQLGGFDLSTLTQPDPTRVELYKAGVRQCTPLTNAPQNWLDYCNEVRAFGSFANGGNSVPYAPLELWAMGLLPDATVPRIQIAKAPVEVDPIIGTFIMFGWDYYTIADIRQRLGQVAPNTATAQKNYRAATVVLTAKDQIDQATLNRITNDLNIMQTRGVAAAMQGCGGYCLKYHNFYSATRNQATIAFGDLSSLRR